MCIICVELLKHKLSVPEAERNLRELKSDAKASDETRAHQGRLLRALEDLDLRAIDEELKEEI